jgi:hypothetical protein
MHLVSSEDVGYAQLWQRACPWTFTRPGGDNEGFSSSIKCVRIRCNFDYLKQIRVQSIKTAEEKQRIFNSPVSQLPML